MGVITKWLPVRDRRGRTVMGSYESLGKKERKS